MGINRRDLTPTLRQQLYVEVELDEEFKKKCCGVRRIIKSLLLRSTGEMPFDQEPHLDISEKMALKYKVKLFFQNLSEEQCYILVNGEPVTLEMNEAITFGAFTHHAGSRLRHGPRLFIMYSELDLTTYAFRDLQN